MTFHKKSLSSDECSFRENMSTRENLYVLLAGGAAVAVVCLDLIYLLR